MLIHGLSPALRKGPLHASNPRWSRSMGRATIIGTDMQSHAPAVPDLGIRLVNVPAVADAALAPMAEFLGQRRGELSAPVTHGLVAEHHAPDHEHFGQVAQAPKHHEGDAVGRVLRPVQRRARALVELLAAFAAPEPAIPPGRCVHAARQPIPSRVLCTASTPPHYGDWFMARSPFAGKGRGCEC